MDKTPLHSHRFVETYNDFVGFGWDRVTDEKTVMYYLQKFSDDQLLARLAPRLLDDELDEIFSLLTRLLKKHLDDAEYHRLFLKDDHAHHPHETESSASDFP